MRVDMNTNTFASFGFTYSLREPFSTELNALMVMLAGPTMLGQSLHRVRAASKWLDTGVLVCTDL